MTDRREAILARLQVIAKAVPGIVLSARNKITPADTQLPAIIIYEADELADPNDPKSIRPANAPRRVMMRPEISIIAGSVPEDVGTLLNGFRVAFLAAVFNDSTLLGIVQDARCISYIGLSTDLANGRTLDGTMNLKIEFTYPLIFGEL